MAEQMTEYVCMACGGSMRFDAASGKMKCDYCDSTYSMEEVKAYYAEENKTNAAQDTSKAAETAWGEELSSMKAYRCQGCGAELVCDDTTAATSCPYCGNVAIMPQQLTGMIRPKYVIPFKIEKEEAKNKLMTYIKGKKLLPGSFTGDHIDEIKGVYVPFWLYNCEVNADVNFDGKKDLIINLGKDGMAEMLAYCAYLKTSEGYTYCRSFEDIRNYTYHLSRDNDDYFARALQFFGNSWMTVNVGMKHELDMEDGSRNLESFSEEELQFIQSRNYAAKRFLLSNVIDKNGLIEKGNSLSQVEQKSERGFYPVRFDFLFTKRIYIIKQILQKSKQSFLLHVSLVSLLYVLRSE